MWILEWKRAPERSKKIINVPLSDRVLWRLYGLLVFLVLFIIILFFLTLFSTKIVSGFILFIEETLILFILLLVVFLLSPIYEEVSGLDRLGRSLAIRDKREMLRNHWESMRAGILKIFFLLLMLSFASSWLDIFIQSFEGFSIGLANVFVLSLSALYVIDIFFALIGYLSTSKRLHSHIRTSNPYWFAWLVTLICYPPFFSWLVLTGLADYRDGLVWSDWLGYDFLFAWVWGIAIIVLTFIYAWSTIIFGIRFSNLTHRGIITNGPYRYTKHPAYLSKNISWWLISVPFISSFSFRSALFACSALVFVNFIYFLRAKAEEKHLILDPKYLEYSKWIQENGIFASLTSFIKFWFPGLTVRLLTLCVLLFSISSVLWLWSTDEGRTYRFISANDAQGSLLISKNNSVNFFTVEKYGSLDGKENYIYPIASLSKLITAAAVYRLILSGELSFDSTAINELKDFNPVDPRFSQITIINLLQHRSGFNRNISDDPLFDGENTVGCKGALKAVESRYLDFDPGTETHYSNIGYCILGEIIEAKLGITYEAAIYEILFDGNKPNWLFMGIPTSDTFYSPTERANEWYLLGPAGGWFANAHFFADFLSTEFKPEAVNLSAFQKPSSVDSFYYGLGWRVWSSGCWSHFGDLPGVLSVATVTNDGVSLGILDRRIKTAEPLMEQALHLCIHNKI